MNHKWLNSFLAVARTGSVTAAAKELYISPQALLQQMNLLEEEVGVSLFSRQRSGMPLTLAGKEFRSGAQQILQSYEDTLSRCRLASRAECSIRIPTMSSLVWPELMEKICLQYRKEFPTARRTVLITDEDLPHWLDGLRNLRYDLIEHFAVDGICPADIHFECLFRVESWCVLAEYHPLAGKDLIRLSDLSGMKLLVPPENQALLSYLRMSLDAQRIRVEFVSVQNDRYQIIAGLNNGGIYFSDPGVARSFIGYVGIPLDFDTRVRHGLACRKDMAEVYSPFFRIAHQLTGESTTQQV